MIEAYDIIDEDLIDVEDDATPAQCFATKEYDMFKQLQGNRPVAPKHVKNLIESMRRENLIKYQTITVNEKFEIVDGQHRFEACKALGIHVHYKVKPGANYKTAGTLNHATEEWKFINYLENFSKNNHPDYIKLEAFRDKYNVSLKRFRYLMSDAQKENFDKEFKSGGFKLIDDLGEISKKIDKINSIIKFLDTILLIERKNFIHTDNFWRALYIILVKKDVDVEDFEKKLSVKYQSIRQMSGYKDYFICLGTIYNHKRKDSKIDLDI